MAKSEKEVAEHAPDAAPAVIVHDTELEALLRAQTEGADADSYAIPFIKVLQSNSPQCTNGHAAYMADARPGMIFNTVSKRLYNSLDIVPVAFKRELLEWKPERKGLVGRHKASASIVLEAKPDAKGRPTLPNGNLLIDTRQHYVLAGSELSPALMPLASTQLKKSRSLMAMVAEAQRNGKIMSYTLTTGPESNDQGHWMGWVVTQGKDLTASAPVRKAMKEFNAAIAAGTIVEDESQFEQTTGGGPSTNPESDEIPF